MKKKKKKKSKLEAALEKKINHPMQLELHNLTQRGAQQLSWKHPLYLLTGYAWRTLVNMPLSCKWALAKQGYLL